MSLLDIHSLITYSAIAPYIGLEPTAKYSVTSACPYCGAQAWAIHQDNRNLEEWHYCSQCKVTGTIIAMAAERLGMLEIEALTYLSGKLQSPVGAEELRTYQAAKANDSKYLRVWECARANMLTPTRDQINFLSRLHWRPTAMSAEKLLEGPSRLFGLMEPKQVRKLLGDVSQRLDGTRKRLRMKEPIVVVPFHNTATRVEGINLTSPSQTMQLRATDYTAYQGSSGFAGLPLLLTNPSDAVVVTSMITNVMQLQIRHFGSNVHALPLVGWRQPLVPQGVGYKTPPPQRKWSTLGGRRVVIWERTPTAATIHHALLENANLSFVGPGTSRQQAQEAGGSRWRAWVCHDPAIDIWRRVVRSSRPCEQALKNWMKKSTPAEQLNLLQDAERYDEDTAEFVRKLMKSGITGAVARKVTVPTGVQPKTAGTSYMTVLERGGKWFNLRGKQLLPGIVRVTHIVVRPSGTKEYVGFFQAGEDKFPFHIPLEEATMSWLREFVAANGVYIESSTLEKNTEKHLRGETFNPFEAARRISQPEMVRGLTSIGWDGGGFQLRNARLIDGTFRQNPEFKLPPDAPGPRRDHCKLTEAVKSALQKEGPEMEVVWAMAIALCAQITSPAVDLPAFPIYVYRNVTREELKEHEPRKPGRPWPECDPFVYSLYNRFEIRMGDYKQKWPHRWPRRLMQLKRALKCDDSGFFVTRGNEAKPKTTDIVVVNAADENLEPRKVTHSSDKIVLNYLRHFSTLHVEEGYTWEEWLRNTHSWICDAFPFADTVALRNSLDRLAVY